MADAYLMQAKSKVDAALAMFDAGLRPEDDIHRTLTEASKTACEALKQLCADEERWKPRQPEKRTLQTALTEILKPKPGQSKCHFNDHLLPLTAKALRAFGFKPPEEAERLVSDARKACESLDSFSDPAFLAIFARQAVEKLRDATCDTAHQLAKERKSRETRKKWRQRAAKLLIWVSATLGTAAIGEAVKPFVPDLSPAGQSAVETVEKKGLQDLAVKGVKQAEQNAAEAQNDQDSAERDSGSEEPPTLGTPTE
jgi:hypothetical protein